MCYKAIIIDYKFTVWEMISIWTARLYFLTTVSEFLSPVARHERMFGVLKFSSITFSNAYFINK